MKKTIYNLLMKNRIKIDYDVFDYGLRTLIRYILYLTILIPISIYLDVLTETFLFIIIFVPLRKNIGGFHFEKNYLCTLFSVAISIYIPFLSKCFVIKDILTIILLFVFFIVTTMFVGTVDNKKKRLSFNEQKYYKRQTILIEVIYFFVCIFFYLNDFSILLNLILLTMIFCMISITLAKWKSS